MENKIRRSKVNRTVYLTIITILVITASLVFVANTITRRSEPNTKETTAAETETPKNTETTRSAETPKSSSDKSISATEGDSVENAEAAVTEGEAEDVAADADAEALPAFIAPVSGIVSTPHSDSILVYSLTMDDYRTHTGVDIEAEDGENVLAVADGRVKQVWSDPMMGSCISVEHSGGAVSIYKNLREGSADNFTSGVSVTQGDVLGCVGESAIIEIANEPHLHFELEVDGVSVDPTGYILFPEA